MVHSVISGSIRPRTDMSLGERYKSSVLQAGLMFPHQGSPRVLYSPQRAVQRSSLPMWLMVIVQPDGTPVKRTRTASRIMMLLVRIRSVTHGLSSISGRYRLSARYDCKKTRVARVKSISSTLEHHRLPSCSVRYKLHHLLRLRTHSGWSSPIQQQLQAQMAAVHAP